MEPSGALVEIVKHHPLLVPCHLSPLQRIPLTSPYLDGIPVTDEDLLLVDVEVHGGDDGEVG